MAVKTFLSRAELVRAIRQLSLRALDRRLPWDLKEIAIAHAILERVEAPADRWVAEFVGAEAFDDLAAIRARRNFVMGEDQPLLNSYRADADAWELYVAHPEPIAQVLQQQATLLVELLNPVDLLMVPTVWNTYFAKPRRGVSQRSGLIDLAAMLASVE